jgi:hypothetical protein
VRCGLGVAVAAALSDAEGREDAVVVVAGETDGVAAALFEAVAAGESDAVCAFVALGVLAIDCVGERTWLPVLVGTTEEDVLRGDDGVAVAAAVSERVRGTELVTVRMCDTDADRATVALWVSAMLFDVVSS